ncbi:MULTISPECIES: methyltransferase [unclassified Agarivorans]|uniref:methyltransferase n=1 Tax=unclassified Agarivorans TaxID=2636026 RepID=UPI0026E17A06|nr:MULTISPECIES: methyltransferase [unclassified Agarivorans]MDO6685283.1 methyltransferase [Agarivorans sp. 3_MG-2023]MDO6715545.1 methyltransferase [Agarivorans sp. 2_MG-2023]
MEFYTKDKLKAVDAIEQAQRLAFAPVAFHTARSLRDLGILEALDEAGDNGLSAEKITALSGVSTYGVKVLLDMGLSAGLVIWHDTDRSYELTRLGYFVLHDGMTRANMDFTADVCYTGLQHLTEAIQEGTPAGLKELGNWDTIYEGLSTLPEPAKQSWFNFDHFYSDKAFPKLLELIFANKPSNIVDIGGNTGKWAIKCCEHNPDVAMKIVDLPQQLAMAKINAEQHGFADRIDGVACNMLDPSGELPKGADIYWMSQFLDCFSPKEIVSILSRVKSAMSPRSSVYILELFPDRQTHEAGAHSLNATSLYFTCLANGNSRFYRSQDFKEFIGESGLEIKEQIDNIGWGHSLIKCQLPAE